MMMIWVEVAGGVGAFRAAGEAVLMADDRGFGYGDGLFETVRVRGGRPVFLARHVARLFEGLARLGFPLLPWDEGVLTERCLNALSENRAVDGVLKIIVTRGTGPRGFEPPDEPEPRLIIQVIQAQPQGAVGAGVSAVLTPWRVDPASPLCYVKHLSALDKVLARDLARRSGATEALFLNLEGCLTEGAANNLFVVFEDRIETPAVICGLLAGVARGVLIEASAELPLPIVEAEIPVARLAEASEAFLTNAVAGVRPLIEVDGRPIGDGRPGSVTEAVAEHYARLSKVP